MLSAVETSKKDFFFVDCGVKFEVPVHIGKHHNVGRLGNYDLVVKHRNAKGGFEIRILPEYFGLISGSIAIGVDQNHDAVACLPTDSQFFTIIYPFCDPDSSLRIDRHVGGVIKHWTFCPEVDFQVFIESELT